MVRTSGTEIVYDIETRTLFKEHPEGRGALERLGLAVAVSWCACHEFQTWLQAALLYDTLCHHERIVSFNGLGFDNRIVAWEAGLDRRPLDNRTLDLLDYIRRIHGWVKLEQLAEGTLGEHKTGTGDEAVQLWKKYEQLRANDPARAQTYLSRLINYCRADVELTLDIYRFGIENGVVRYRREGREEVVQVDWR